MTPKAKQILEYLHKRFPDMLFEWENIIWIIGDNTPCTLFASFRTSPDKKVSIIYSKEGDGIANVTPKSIADRDIPHLISQLKGSVDH